MIQNFIETCWKNFAVAFFGLDQFYQADMKEVTVNCKACDIFGQPPSSLLYSTVYEKKPA